MIGQDRGRDPLQRIRLTVLPVDNGSVNPDLVESAITPDTRLMVTSYREDGPVDVAPLKQREQAVSKRVKEDLYGLD